MDEKCRPGVICRLISAYKKPSAGQADGFFNCFRPDAGIDAGELAGAAFMVDFAGKTSIIYHNDISDRGNNMLDHIILGMLCHCRLSGYELKKSIESKVGLFYKASYGSIYPTLTHLRGQGLITVTEEMQGSRKKKMYDITPAGRQAFQSWLREPFDPEEGNDRSHLVKVYFLDMLPDETAGQFLLDYEASIERGLNHLQKLSASYDQARIGRAYYYKLSTLYYGIGILRETLRWCRFIREKQPLTDFIGEAVTDENRK